MIDAADQLLFDRISDVIADGDDLTHEHIAESVLQHAMEYRDGCEQAARDRAKNEEMERIITLIESRVPFNGRGAVKIYADAFKPFVAELRGKS
jgi:hypothetical protein